MPIHEYQCEKCGHIFEEVSLKMSDAKKSSECPKCNKDARKLISSGSFTVHGFNANNGYAGHMR